MLRHLSMLLVLCLVGGCYTTTVKIDSTPQGADVHYDFEPKGKTPVEFEVEWHGVHKVTLDHPEYGRRVEYVTVETPAYQTFPLDFFATIAPWNMTDRHEFHFDLTQVDLTQTPPKTEDTEATEDPSE